LSDRLHVHPYNGSDGRIEQDASPNPEATTDIGAEQMIKTLKKYKGHVYASGSIGVFFACIAIPGLGNWVILIALIALFYKLIYEITS
jgi:hypothetical protein